MVPHTCKATSTPHPTCAGFVSQHSLEGLLYAHELWKVCVVQVENVPCALCHTQIPSQHWAPGFSQFFECCPSCWESSFTKIRIECQLFPHYCPQYSNKHLKCFPHLENHLVRPQVYKVPVCNHLLVGLSSLSAFSYCRNKTSILICVPSISLLNSLILKISLRKLGKSGLNFSWILSLIVKIWWWLLLAAWL